MASDDMVMAALGRPFTLGMLYDARKDQLHTGFTLWDKKTLQQKSSVRAQHSSAFDVSASDSIESKSFLLDVDGSLKASFLSGLIDVAGSAKYLNDEKQFKNQSRVTLQYKATTTFQQLVMTDKEAEDKLNAAVMQKESATHVVTGILYGANAFFVFDSEKLDSRSVQSIQGSMQALIKKIPKFEIGGKVSIKLTAEEKALTNKFSCRFIGDFILSNNPATFEDAVQTYIDLPKLLGKNQDIAVPMKVWLTPLKKYDPTAAELVRDISPGLVRKAEHALEAVREAEMRCNESLEDRVVAKVPQVSKMLRKYQKLCKDYKGKLQQTMERKFPLIRAGKEDDSSVEKLFEDRKRSPFSNDKLNNWMNDKEREINVIRSCVSMMAGTNVKMVANQSELDREVLAPGVAHALCFVFTVLERDDPYLDQMANYLRSQIARNAPPLAQELWYNSERVVHKMRQTAKAFHEFANDLKNNTRFIFLVAALPNNKYQGATIYHYKDGLLATDHFSATIPNVKTVSNRTNLIWYACDLTMDPKAANGWLSLSHRNKKATCGEWQVYPDVPERFDTRPQVLCKEALSRRHYWEVEWSKGSENYVGVAVTYRRIERKGNGSASGLGSNDMSWYFGEDRGSLCAWHNGRVWSGSVPSTGCSKVGVYLDWPAGTLSFYDVTCNTLTHLYTFATTFTEPVFPGFYVYYKSNYAALCPM